MPISQDPPPSANQKRKRGRPTNASREADENDAPTSKAAVAPQINQHRIDGEADDDGDTESRPRKRGRPAKSDIAREQVPRSASPKMQPSRQKRRQPVTAQAEEAPAETTNKLVLPMEAKTNKRGRPKKQEQRAKLPEPEPEEADDENENQSALSLRRSQRRRSSPTSSPTVQTSGGSQQEKDVGSSSAQPVTKRRGRPTKPTDKEGQREADVGVVSGAQARKNKKGQAKEPEPSIIEAEPEPVLLQKKRGRKPKDDSMTSAGRLQTRTLEQQQGSADEEAPVDSRPSKPSTTQRKPRGRRRSHEAQDQSPARSSSTDSIPSPAPYRYIAKRTRRVTHEVIESKWSTLDTPSVTNVITLLQSVSLPTLLHVVPKQYAHAEEVLEKVIRGLRKRSARLPFPPASSLPRREDELDFERTQSAVEVLISQLDPLQHSVELLRREKERAEKVLEREYKVLDRLSTNARAEARERKDRLKKVHALVPETTRGTAVDHIDLLPAEKAAGQVFANIRGEELLGLAGQVNSHMESMRGNLQQIEGVLPAIARSHAQLRTALQPRLSQQQMDNIVLDQLEK